MVLTADDEQVLWWVLHRHATAPASGNGFAAAAGGGQAGGPFEEGGSGSGSSGGEPSLNYDDYVQVSWHRRSWLCMTIAGTDIGGYSIGPAPDAHSLDA